MKIDKETVREVAVLARLELSDAELEKFLREVVLEAEVESRERR